MITTFGKALKSVDIVIPRVFFQILGFQPLCLSEVDNCILSPWMPSALTSRKAFLMSSYPLQLHAVEPSELALNPKTSCFSAAHGLWLMSCLVLFSLSLTVSFTAISLVQASISCLYCVCIAVL